MAAHIAENYTYIRDTVEKACLRVGRVASEITIVAVTKTIDIDRIETGVAAGMVHLGENRSQEIVRKKALIGGDVHWHLIGQLQRNKVKDMIGAAWLIHSLDRISLADEIQKRAEQQGIIQPVLIQVNVSGEETKSGMAAEEVLPFIEKMQAYPSLKVMGLMTMAQFFLEPEQTRPVFKTAKILYDNIADKGFPHVDMRYLSMGMSNDYEIAVEEGATMVRIGRALFGERVYG